MLAAAILAIGCIQPILAAEPAEHPRIILIIRHAEKPADAKTSKDPDLSERGLERAKALAKVILEEFPKPDFLFAAKASKHSNRPVETITPLAEALHEPIESPFEDKDYKQLAEALLGKPEYAGKVILIAWHHEKIPHLAEALGVKHAPKEWDGKVYDRVWEISYEGHKAKLRDLPQHALADDAQK